MSGFKHFGHEPSENTKKLWVEWWRKYCDNDQSEAPTMCSAHLAQQFAEWMAIKELSDYEAKSDPDA